MRFLKRLLRAVRSLGILGVVMLLGVSIIVLSAVNFLSVLDAVALVYEDIVKLDHLKDVVEFNSLEQVLYAGYYADSGEEVFLEDALTAGDDLDEAMNYYRSDLDFDFPFDQETEVARLESTLSDQAALLDGLDDAVRSEDLAALATFQGEFEVNARQIRDLVQGLIQEAELALDASSAQAARQATTAVVVGVASLLVMPFMAIVTFGVAGGVARPILALTTAVTSLGGGQFRTSLTQEISARRDLFGGLARAIEALAAESATQEEELRREIETLRGELRESRRQKLVYSTRPKDYGGEV